MDAQEYEFSYDEDDDYSGCSTPLMEACRGGLESLARLLVDKGAKINARLDGEVSPLHVACRMGRESIARMLIERGADVHALHSGSGATPLVEALAHGGLGSIVALLIERGATRGGPWEHRSPYYRWHR